MASLNICVKACLTFWILFSESFKLESRKADFFSYVTKWLVYCFLSQNILSAALFIPCSSCLYGLEKAGGRLQPVCPTLCRYLKGVEASRRSSVAGCSQRSPLRTEESWHLRAAVLFFWVSGVLHRHMLIGPPRLPFSVQVARCGWPTHAAPQPGWRLSGLEFPLLTKEVCHGHIYTTKRKIDSSWEAAA